MNSTELNLKKNLNYVNRYRLADLPTDRKIVVGIQGGKGSFNEQAATEIMRKYEITDYELVYLYTTDAVLKAVAAGEVDYGQFAVHNSVGGVVEESMISMANHIYGIVEEFAIQIQHYLMKSKASKIEDIDTIMTHPQVLKQCKSNLEEKYSHLEMTSGEGDLIDHANVAKEIGEGRMTNNVAVMGPQILSEIYDLDIIEGDLQDQDENWTSFLLVQKV